MGNGISEPPGPDLGSAESGLTAPGALTYAQIANKFRTAVVAAVHIEHKSIQSRSRNFIISGLNPIDNMDDSKLIHRFLAEFLGLTVTVTSCRRIGKSTVELPQRLLVTLGSADQAASVINASRKLRLSNNPEISGKIYINADLTIAEQKAAYELRCKHRLAKQKRINQDLHARSHTAPRSGLGSTAKSLDKATASARVLSSDVVSRAGTFTMGDNTVTTAAASTASAASVINTTDYLPTLSTSSALVAGDLPSARQSGLSASASPFNPFVTVAMDGADGPLLANVDGRLPNGATS